MKNLIFIIVILITTSTFAQSYRKIIGDYRKEYKEGFITDEHSPIKKEEIDYLRFYNPDKHYKVNAKFIKTQLAYPFDMATLDGQKRKYIEYGTLVFNLKGKSYTLKIYQNLSLMDKPEYQDLLFLPFTDLTNGKETYTGGRYLDYHIPDIRNNILELDFNKAYNPYCAYSNDYSCPRPPEENNLNVAIKAGEKKFGRESH
jgi:uncharacterized protein (DUF1684 family)